MGKNKRLKSLKHIAAVRKLVEANKAWEATAGTDQQTELPTVYQIVGDGEDLLNPMSFTCKMTPTNDEIRRRMFKRLQRNGTYDRMREIHELNYMRRYDRHAYETHMLRQEVAELSSKVDTVTAA